MSESRKHQGKEHFRQRNQQMPRPGDWTARNVQNSHGAGVEGGGKEESWSGDKRQQVEVPWLEPHVHRSQGCAFTPPRLGTGCSLHQEFGAFSVSSLQLCSSLFPGESEGCVFSVPTTLWMHPDTSTDSTAWLSFVFVSPGHKSLVQRWCPNRGVQETVCGGRLGVNDGAEQSRESALYPPIHQ